MSTSKKSLKFKLIAMCMGITFLLGISSLGVLRYILSTQESSILRNFASNADALNDSIAAQFFERYGDIQAFAISPAVQSSNRTTIVEMLNSWAAMYGIYDLIMVVDAKGHLVAVNNKSPDGKTIAVQPLYQSSYADAPWFKAVMAGQFTEDKEKGFSGTYVEDIQIDPWTSQLSGSNRLGSSFSAAVKDGHGHTMGVITNRAGSRWFEGAFKEVSANLRNSGYPSSELTLLSGNGTVLFNYKTDANEKNTETQYDWNELLKENLLNRKLASAVASTAGKSGSVVEPSPRTGEEGVVGYSPVNGPKFVDKIGWSILIRDSRAEAMHQLNRAQNIFFLIFGAMVALACVISFIVSTGISRTVSGLAARLSEGSQKVLAAATSIAQSSTELSEAATEQASAIQETAASIDEVSSMIKKSADNATQSQKVSKTSREAAERGQQSVQEMIHAIDEISRSNTSIMNQVAEGNQQIGEIVKVIAEIGTKTRVINDIVFQTKLLSFNASVEAARAGEHGKGFAVVAEEVGNLAQMSGNAAKEISSMLESSIHKVEAIVVDTKSKVEKLVVESRTRVEEGTKVAQRCGEALGNIIGTVQEVDGMVGEISSASQEQAQGVAEINKAMNQLDQVTQQNTQVAQTAATSAEQLNDQANQLREVVSDLFTVVNGQGASTPESFVQTTHRSGLGSGPGSAPEHMGSNVVRLPLRRQAETAAPMRAAAGGEFASSSKIFPSKDDPRFEDV